MNLEIGMYVRTDIGEIAKLVESRHFENKTGNYNYLRADKDIEYAIYDDLPNIHVKIANFELIDLIEVGDYVNGELVEDITGEYLIINGQSHNKHYFSKQIKSIVTKDQFEQMSYKVGE